MSWKDLYSEVKKRKMEALNKKDVVQAVERHGKILAIDGDFEKPKKIIQHIYASEKKVIKPKDILKTDLNLYDIVLIGCPGKADALQSSIARSKIKDFVSNGGWLLTTDWCIHYIVDKIFPGFITWNQKRTEDAVVACQILEPNHPFLEGVIGEIQQSKWSKQSTANTKKEEFRWWLETKSFPVKVINSEVRILIASHEIKRKWGEAPVMVEFSYGQKGGRVIHMISHTHLQKGGAKGKFASALILTNILDEKISQKMSLGTKPEQRYVSDWETQPQQQAPQSPLEDQWVTPPQQSNYITPTTSGSELLSGTSQIIEANDTNFSFASKCVYCEDELIEFIGKIYLCKECGAAYHENCLNLQINEGTCKKCSRILLW